MSVIFDARCIKHDKPTGVGVYSSNLMQYLQTSFQNEMIVFSNSFKKNKITSSFPNVHTRIPNKLLHSSIAFFKKPTIESLARQNYELTNNTTIIAPNINFISLEPNTKFILVFHDLSFEHFPNYYSLKMRVWHKLIKPKELAHRASHIVAVSKSTADDVIATYNIAPEKVHIAHPGLPLLPYSLPTLQGLPQKYVLCISSIEPRKNIPTLCHAFAELIKNPIYNDLHLILIGQKGYKGNELLKFIKKYQIKERFHYVGYLPTSAKYALLKQSSIFVYPSFFEGFGFPPLEAMRMGIPVIASRTPSLQEVLGDSALLANPYRPSEFTLAMDALLSDKNLYFHFSNIGRMKADQYTWDKTVSVFTSLIR